MAIREQHYFIFDAGDIRPDALAFEILSFEDHFRDCPFPLIYLSAGLDEISRMLEEVVQYREDSLGIKDMERTSQYYLQVQRTRLVSLDPMDSERKWGVFRRVVEGYNLGDVGCCSHLGDFLELNGARLLETVSPGRGEESGDSLSLPGNEKEVARIINSYNRAVLNR